jgi:ABC-type sugar transport system permease subunit
MSAPQYPETIPWRPIGAIVLTVASFFGSVSLWKRQAPLLEREYLTSYVRASYGELPGFNKYTVYRFGKRWALPTDEGKIYESREKVNLPEFERYLRMEIYGTALWRVLLYPLLSTLAVFLCSMWYAIRAGRNADRDAWDGKLKRGARIISNRQWNRLIPSKNRGFYIETK